MEGIEWTGQSVLLGVPVENWMALSFIIAMTSFAVAWWAIRSGIAESNQAPLMRDHDLAGAAGGRKATHGVSKRAAC
jgi:hypothetical protein